MGTEVHWVELGTGRPMVLLHGLNDSHRTWNRVARALASGRRVLMPDLQGHGLSGRPDANYSLAWHAEVVAGWMALLGLDDVDLVGHSFGGGVAQQMLLVCRERVRRLCLVAPGGLGREVALGLRLASLPGLIEGTGQPWMGIGTRIGMRLAGGNFEPADVEALAWMNTRPGTARAFARTVRDVIDLRGQRRSFLERAHEVAELPPIAVYWGRHDRVIPSRQAQQMLGRLEGVHFAEFAACGHFPHREHADRFASLLTQFADAEHAPPARLVRAVSVPVHLTHPGVFTRMARAFKRAWRAVFSARPEPAARARLGAGV